MKIGVAIAYHPKLAVYLEAVKEQFSIWDKIVVNEFDFMTTPEETARNLTVKSLSDCDLVWIVDADEFILQQDQRIVVDRMVKRGGDCGFVKLLNYRSMNTALPETDHKPIVIIRPGDVKFYDGRCAHYSKPIICDNVILHHFGCVLPAEAMEWKAKNYWNKSNPKQYAEMLKENVEQKNIPSEIADRMSRFMSEPSSGTRPKRPKGEKCSTPIQR